jgi:hypothetical protein
LANPIASATNFAEILNFNFEQPARKKDPKYGLQLLKSLYKENSVTDGYFIQRNNQWKINDQFAQGKLDALERLKLLGIENPDKSYVPIDPALLKVAPRYLQSLLGGFMNREERASVNATGVLSYQKKESRKIQAMFRMKNAAKIADMQAASGIEHEQGYTPQDQDELEWHYKIVDRLPEESGFEQRIDEVFENSDDENRKRELLSDLIKYNIAAEKVVVNNSKTKSLANRLGVRRCRPQRLIYNKFERPNGSDIRIIGEIYPMSISEGRKEYPNVSEQDWFKLAEKASKVSSPFNPILWNERYLTDYNRPYDDYKFMVLDSEVKTSDKDYYVKSVDNFGKDVLQKKKGKPNPQFGETVVDEKYSIYAGIWAIDTDIMLSWGIAPNMIRPYQNGIDCYSSYSVVYPDADGTLIPSLLERGIPIIKSLIDTYLKIQQMKRTMRPDGVAVDISGLDDVDLGSGAIGPMEIKKIYDQTGFLYWKRRIEDGVPNPEQNQIPYETIPNSANVAQINTLIGLYNFELQRLNDEWGTNPDALGQQVAARRGKQVNENQIAMANQATEYIYDFYLTLKKQTASKIAMKLWDITILESEDYKEMEDVDIKDLINQEFDVNIDFVPINQDRDWLDKSIEIALERQTISIGEATRIRNMDNIKDAELYLIKLEKKSQEAAAQAKQQDYKNNAQLQQASLQQKGQVDAQLIQEKANGDAMVITSKLELEGYNSIINMVSGMVQESMKTGTPIPANMQPVVDFVIQTTIAKGNPQPQGQAQDAQQESPQQEQAEPQQEPQPQEQAEQPQ